MATLIKYVVDKDWDSQQVTDIVSYQGAGQNFTFGTDGYASIYETILDANGIAVSGAVGTATTQTDPVPYTGDTRQYVFVVNGRFNETAEAAAAAKYTLDFSSIYSQESLLTSFTGSFTSAEANDVGFRVSKGTVLFGETAVYETIYKKDAQGNFLDANDQIIDLTAADAESKKVVIGQENTNRTTITLNRTVNGDVGKWADSEFVVGGALAAADLATVTARVTNTDLTVAHWVWVGSAWGVNETANDAVSNDLVVNDSTVKGTTLQVRHVGDLKATNSTFAFKDMILRGDATFDKTTITLSTDISNVYGENNSTATLTLKNGSTLTSTTDFQIGKPDSTEDVKRAGALVLNASSIGFATVIPDDPATTDVNESATVITRSGDIAVKQNGTITMDAASKIYATALTNDGTINITIDAAGEDWINIASTMQAPAVVEEPAVVGEPGPYPQQDAYASQEAFEDACLDWQTQSDNYDQYLLDKAAYDQYLLDKAAYEESVAAASFVNTGKINIAGSFDGGVKRVIYATSGSVNKADVEVTATSTTGEDVTAATRAGKVAIAAGVNYTTIYLSNRIDEDDDFAKAIKNRAETVTYYIDFNAFQKPASALEDGVTADTKTILIDGGDRNAVTYTSETTASIDGLTFAKDGTNAVADDPATANVDESQPELNVVFTLTGMDPANPESYRELKKGITVEEGVTFTADKLYQSGKDAVTTINGELAMAANDTFQVAAGKVNVTSTGSRSGDGIVSVIATLRDAEGKPIKAELNVTGAPITLNKLEIGANSTVTLKNIKADAEGKSQAVFKNVVMRKTNVEDFVGPVLTIINSQVDVTNSFDTTKGLVNINFQSQLFVKTATATIEGGTLNLTVTADDVTLLSNYGKTDPDTGELVVPQPELFYTIVHGKLASAVNLTCDGDLDGDGYIDGTKYIYTNLADSTGVGQGLFVMHEDVAKNIYVNEAWTNKEIGEVVGDGMFYGINAFETFTGALSAATARTNATSITLLSNVTENGLETMTYKLQNLVTVKGNYTVVWNVTTQTADDGSVYFCGDKDKTSEKLTFEAGTTYEAHGMGPIYIGYNPANDKGYEDRMDAEFNGTIQNSTVYVNRWSNLTVNGTITGGAQIYIRKHGKILIDGTGRTSEDPQVSTTGAALIYGGTTTVLNSVVSFGGQLKVSNRNVTEEDPNNMPAETTVFAATNSKISANSFDSNKVGSETKGDEKDSVTSLVKSTMTIANGVNNFGAIYVGVAVKAKDITEGQTIVKNTVEVDDTVTDAASTLSAGSVTNSGEIFVSGSELLVGSTVSNTGVISFTSGTGTEQVQSENPDDPNGDPIVTTQQVVVPSIANITKDLINNGEFSITGSTVNVGKIQNGNGSVYGTINVLQGGVLNTTTAGSLDNKGYGIINVTGGTITADSNSFTAWNYGVMNLNDANIVYNDNVLRNAGGGVINVKGNVDMHDKNGAVGKISNGNKVVFGVSNTGTGAADVKVNIAGGKVAFSADNLSFDWAATGVTADEAVASAKLSGGTVFVDRKGITLFDTGFKVVDVAAVADDPATTDVDETVAEVSHRVYNNTNAISITADGALTLDAGAADYQKPQVWTVTGLSIAAGGNLTMNWTSVLKVASLNDVANTGKKSITIDMTGFNGIIETDKLLIDQNDTTLTIDSYDGIMTNPKNWFKVGEGDNAGDLYLNAAAFAKVSQSHTHTAADLANGWYNEFNDTEPGTQDPTKIGAADHEPATILVLDGTFAKHVFLNGVDTDVVGNGDKVLKFSTYGFCGGFDVAALDMAGGVPAALNLKYVEGTTDVTINTGTFSNSTVVGGDFIRLATTDETKVNFYRVGGTSLVINGGDFAVTSDGGERTINGGLYYNAPKNADGVRAPIGFANLTGDVTLTISGGTFKGYNVYGGNNASAKSLGKYTMIDGSVNLKLDASKNALTFAPNNKGKAGNIYGGSFGAGAISGSVTVTLTGDKGIAFETLFGGCTGDVRTSVGYLDSNVAGKRTLSFTGYKGDLDFDKVQAFDTVNIDAKSTVTFKKNILNEKTVVAEGTDGNPVNIISREVDYSNIDVVNWNFAFGATYDGAFDFDFASYKNAVGDVVKDTLSIDTAAATDLTTTGVVMFGADFTFTNLDQLNVKLGGVVATADEGNTSLVGIWTTDDYKLTINNSGMTLAKA